MAVCLAGVMERLVSWLGVVFTGGRGDGEGFAGGVATGDEVVGLSEMRVTDESSSLLSFLGGPSFPLSPSSSM